MPQHSTKRVGSVTFVSYAFNLLDEVIVFVVSGATAVCAACNCLHPIVLGYMHQLREERRCLMARSSVFTVGKIVLCLLET